MNTTLLVKHSNNKLITINCNYVSNYYAQQSTSIIAIATLQYNKYTFIWITYELDIHVNERETEHVNKRMIIIQMYTN